MDARTQAYTHGVRGSYECLFYVCVSVCVRACMHRVCVCVGVWDGQRVYFQDTELRGGVAPEAKGMLLPSITVTASAESFTLIILQGL